MSGSTVNRLVFALSLAGFFVSSFLFYEYNFSLSVACPIGNGCDIVRTSPYSTFLGISIPVLGIAYYLTMTVLAAHQSSRNSRLVVRLQATLAALAFLFGLYLTYLEGFVIKAYCTWCLISFIISIAILILIIRLHLKTGNKVGDS